MPVMPRDEKDRIHQALEKAGGNRKVAAVMLGLTPIRLKDKLHASPELKARWCETSESAPVPDDVAALNKAMPEVLPGPEPPKEEVDLRVAAALTKDGADSFKDGLLAMNLPTEVVQVATEMMKFNQAHFVRTLHMLAGGATRQAAMINHQMDSGWQRLQTVRELISATVKTDEEGKIVITNPVIRELLVSEESNLMSGQTELARVLNDFFKTAFNAGQTMAEVLARLKGGGKPDGKPGFSGEKDTP